MLTALKCPPGIGHKKCAHGGSNSGSGGSSGGGGSSGTSGGSSASSSGGSSGGSTTSSSSGGSSSGGGSASTSSSSSGGGDGSGSDDAVQANGYSFEADDNYSWESSNLDNGAGSSVSIGGGSSAKSIGAFIFVAMAAGLAGAAFMVSRKNREEEENNHPLEGSLRKRMKLFTGGVLRQPRMGGSLNIPGVDDNPSFIEIASVRTGLSSRGGVGADTNSVISAASGVSETSSRASSYVAPVETLTENPTEESEVSIV